ncbi:MAG: hypothetical protein LDL50_02410 [Chloroflexi bacterium]|nr:hypothetical protein [Chloroflexota bacterium]MCA2001090.1 hypothetical protein [Chloroflexota bacterium]
MDSIKKPLGIFFAVLFALTAAPALVFFNFDQRAFTPQTYQKAFANSDFYNKLPASMAESMLAGTTDPNQLPIVMRGMSRQAWEEYFRAMLPPETLKAMGDETLNAVFAYLQGQTDTVQVSLAPLKTNMTSDAGAQAVFALLATQPACTLEQIAQATMNLLNNNEIQFCNPPAELIPLLTPAIQGQMQAAAFAIPDQLTLFSAPPQNDPRDALQTARLAMRLSPILPLGFLLLLTVVAVRSLKDWLNWWGVPLAVTGGLTAFLGLVGASAFGAVFQQTLANRMPAFLPALLLDSANALAAAMLQALFLPILWQGLGIAFIGFGMAAAGYFIKK